MDGCYAFMSGYIIVITIAPWLWIREAQSWPSNVLRISDVCTLYLPSKIKTHLYLLR